MAFALLLTLGPGFSGCRSGDRDRAHRDSSEGVDLLSEAALTDPPPSAEDQAGGGPSRCGVAAATAILSAASASGKPAAVEFSQAAPAETGFAIGVLSSSEESVAEMAHLGTDGSLQRVSLGRVFGQADPPKVVSWGAKTIAVVSDNDAANATLRIARLDGRAGGVTWGPEIGRGRGALSDFDVSVLTTGGGLLVWDEEDRPSRRGRILGLPFDAGALKAVRPAAPLTGAQEDVAAPRVFAGAKGHWLLYLVSDPHASPIGPSGPGLDESPLVSKARHRIQVLQVDSAGKARGPGVVVSEGWGEDLVFDGVIQADGSLLVAYRESPVDRPPGGTPVRLATVDPSGGVERSVASAQEELGPGAPVLLAADKSPWLSVAGPGGRVLLASAAGGRAELTEEPRLFGSIPLASAGGHLLVARPRSLDVDLEILRCQP